jgi:hypothetical protein
VQITIFGGRKIPTPKKRFTLDLEPEMQIKLKVAAALKGVSMRQYCVQAIESQLILEEGNGEANGLAKHSLLRMTKLRDEIFGGVPLEGDSTDLIRESREERSGGQ